MRKTIRVSFLLFVTNLLSGSVFAQLPKTLVFANFTYAVPANTDFKKISNYGLGFEAGAGVSFGKTMLIGSIGHINYNLPEQSVGGVILFEQEDYKVTPIKFGVRQYLLSGLFVSGNLGMAISNSKTHFLYEAGAGYKLGFFEIGAAYTGYKLSSSFNANSLLLKAGFDIKI